MLEEMTSQSTKNLFKCNSCKATHGIKLNTFGPSTHSGVQTENYFPLRVLVSLNAVDATPYRNQVALNISST